VIGCSCGGIGVYCSFLLFPFVSSYLHQREMGAYVVFQALRCHHRLRYMRFYVRHDCFIRFGEKSDRTLGVFSLDTVLREETGFDGVSIIAHCCTKVAGWGLLHILLSSITPTLSERAWNPSLLASFVVLCEFSIHNVYTRTVQFLRSITCLHTSLGGKLS
jgi:hypothetical protein